MLTFSSVGSITDRIVSLREGHRGILMFGKSRLKQGIKTTKLYDTIHGVYNFFVSVKFANSLLASLAEGLINLSLFSFFLGWNHNSALFQAAPERRKPER